MSSNTSSASDKVEKFARGVKGAFAAVHGAGETARGTFNGGIDRAFNEPTNRGQGVAEEGKKEMETGKFGEKTKAREGVAPGDSEWRKNREL